MPGRKGEHSATRALMTGRLTPSRPSVATFTAVKIRHPTGIFPTDTDGLSRDRPIRACA